MKIAILTHLPFWYADTMYLKEVEKRLNMIGITTKVFVIEGLKTSTLFNRIGLTSFLKISNILKKLSCLVFFLLLLDTLYQHTKMADELISQFS